MFWKCRPVTYWCPQSVSSYYGKVQRTYGKTTHADVWKCNEKSGRRTQRMKYEWKFKWLLLFAIICPVRASSCVRWRMRVMEMHAYVCVCVCIWLRVSSINQFDYIIVVAVVVANERTRRLSSSLRWLHRVFRSRQTSFLWTTAKWDLVRAKCQKFVRCLIK